MITIGIMQITHAAIDGVNGYIGLIHGMLIKGLMLLQLLVVCNPGIATKECCCTCTGVDIGGIHAVY